MALGPVNSSRLPTGLQDNGSVRNWSPTSEPTDLSQFTSYFGGDGHWVAIDPNNQNVFFACFQNANCQGKLDANGATTNWPFQYPSNQNVPADQVLRYTTDAPIG